MWGTSDRYKNKISKVNRGDFLVFYIKKKGIGGILKASSQMYINQRILFDNAEFSSREVFPLRIRITKFIVLKEYLPFKKLILELSFIKRKDKKWATSLQGRALFKIQQSDYQIILNEVKKGD